MINCDQSFDLLTRGRPPAEVDEFRLEQHLEHCPSCRRLADALRPAIDLFQESLHADDDYCTPGMHDDDAFRRSVSVSPANSSQTAASARSQWTSRDVLPLAAAVVVGLFLGSGVWSGGDANPPRLAAPLSLTAWQAHARDLPHDLVMSLKLAEACLAPSIARSDSAARQAAADPTASLQLACCTLCHSISGEAATAEVSIARLANSCRVCHLN